MQLHVNALTKNDEFMLDQFIVQDKFHLLIVDLLVTAVWKKKMIPVIKSEITSFNSMKVYMTIYHEAVVCNMLEVMMFYYTAVSESNKLLIEIIDYCYKKITPQIAKAVQNRIKQRQKTDEEKSKKFTD